MGIHGNSGVYHAFYKSIDLPLSAFREVTSAGAVANVAGIGGNLASDTTPIFGAQGTSEAWALKWAAGNADIVQCEATLPDDFDGREDLLLDLEVLTDNAGGGSIEAASFSVLTSFDNAAQVTDSATDSTPATTVHTVTTTIAASDIPDAARLINVQLVPGTHAADPIHLMGAKLRYLPRKTS